MPRRQPGKATTAILVYANSLDRKYDTLRELILIAADLSTSQKVRGRAFFYLGCAACELADRIDEDPVRYVQTVFLFFTKTLKVSPMLA